MTSGKFYMPEDRHTDGFMWPPCVRLRRLWFLEKTSNVLNMPDSYVRRDFIIRLSYIV